MRHHVFVLLIICGTYTCIAQRIHQLSGAQGGIITPAHKAHTSFLKPSQLPGEYTAQLLPLQRI